MEIQGIFCHSVFMWKSILGNLEVLKLPIFAILGSLNFVNLVNFSYKKCKNSWKSNFRASNCAKMVVFGPQKSPTSISRKMWVIETHCGNYRNSLSRLFNKNFVKATILLKKILKSWFHGIFFQWERISRFSTLCTLY